MNRTHIIFVLCIAAVLGGASASCACDDDQLFARLQSVFQLPAALGRGNYLDDLEQLRQRFPKGTSRQKLEADIRASIGDSSDIRLLTEVGGPITAEVFCEEDSARRRINVRFWLDEEGCVRNVTYSMSVFSKPQSPITPDSHYWMDGMRRD